MRAWPPITGLIFMTTGKTRNSGWLPRVGLLLCLLTLSGAALATPWSLDGLFDALAQHPRQEVDFVEERHDQLLGVPLSSRGTLYYRAPDTLQKTLSQGGEGSFRFEGDELHIEQGGRARSVELDSHPALRALATMFRALLGGDRAALERYFQLELNGTREQWHLQLSPQQRELARLIREVNIYGSADRILRLETEERSGDRVSTRLLDHRDGSAQ